MTEAVLDASAVLAHLRNEPLEEGARDVLFGAAISAVNAAEVAAKLIDYGAPEDRATDFAAQLDLDIVPFDMPAAERSAALRAATRAAGLSLGDRACLALGMQRDLPVLTTDTIWSTLALDIDVRVVR